MQIGKKARKTETKEKVANLIKTFGKSATNTGSTESQIAIITDRINTLNPHFQKHVKDFHSRRGLQALVNKRRKLLVYLKRNDKERYVALIQKLGLRDSY